ncbi:MAG: hypothetical protein ACP5Q0_04345, partial [Halothiobacillus sp.]
GMGATVKPATVASYTSVLNGLCLVQRQGHLDSLIARIDRILDRENDPKVRTRMPKSFFTKLGKITTAFRAKPTMNDADIRAILVNASDKSALQEIAAHCTSAHKALSAMIDKSLSLGPNIAGRTSVYRAAMNDLVILSGYLEGLATVEQAEREAAKAENEADNQADIATLEHGDAPSASTQGGFISNKAPDVEATAPQNDAVADELDAMMDAIAA